MPQYRRLHIAGASVFLTIVAHKRRPLFADVENVARLRTAVMKVQADWPFQFDAAVVLPDHMHFLWTLPSGDASYSKRVGRLKVLFSQSLATESPLRRSGSTSRRKQHETDVWQRRFYEHTIRDEDDFKVRLDYMHFNAVKHGYVSCPHQWPHSSFSKWVALGEYAADWGCVCDGRPRPDLRYLDGIGHLAGE